VLRRGEYCVLFCEGQNSCHGVEPVLRRGEYCVLFCEGQNSCHGVEPVLRRGEYCVLFCEGQNSCHCHNNVHTWITTNIHGVSGK